MSPRLVIYGLRFCARARSDACRWPAPQVRSFDSLTTGNGHGFAVFDRPSGTIQTLLEHPYRFVAPLNAARDGGVGRRDLAHDLYFGVRSGDQRVWLERTNAQTQVSYEAESHIIHGASQLNGLGIDTYYFSPFGYEGNALIALIRVRNDGATSAQASVFFKPNLKLGSTGATREDPLDDDESIVAGGRHAAARRGDGRRRRSRAVRAHRRRRSGELRCRRHALRQARDGRCRRHGQRVQRRRAGDGVRARSHHSRP